MTDHIIKAAREAGFDWTDLGVQDRLAFERFYAIAFKAGMERAAEIAKARHDHEVSAVAHHAGRWHEAFEHHMTRQATMMDVLDAIRAEAHAQNQPKTTHDGSVVSKN